LLVSQKSTNLQHQFRGQVRPFLQIGSHKGGGIHLVEGMLCDHRIHGREIPGSCRDLLRPNAQSPEKEFQTLEYTLQQLHHDGEQEGMVQHYVKPPDMDP
jgi:hypothetical protein